MKKIITALFILLFANTAFAQQQTQDITPLFKKITEMANAGEAEAAYHLGMLYRSGIGVDPDPKEALRWFKIAANKNDSLAAYELGAFYSGKYEDIEASDPEEVFRTLKTAAEDGFAMAEYDVGVMYLNFRNGTMGTRFIERAAKQGLPMAYQTLSLLKFRGDMVERDLIGSRAYLKLFVDAIGPEAGGQFAAIITQIEGDLSPEQIVQSDEMVKGWEVKETELSVRANKGLIRTFEYAGMPVPASLK